MPLLRGWFTSTPRPPTPKGTPKAANAPAANVGTLMSADSLRTFGGLTFGIGIVWGGIERIFNLPHLMWIGGGLSLIVGAVLLYDDLTDPNRLPTPRLHMRVLAAVVNTFVLYGAASTAVGTVPTAGAVAAATAAPSGVRAAAPTPSK